MLVSGAIISSSTNSTWALPSFDAGDAFNSISELLSDFPSLSTADCCWAFCCLASLPSFRSRFWKNQQTKIRSQKLSKADLTPLNQNISEFGTCLFSGVRFFSGILLFVVAIQFFGHPFFRLCFFISFLTSKLTSDGQQWSKWYKEYRYDNDINLKLHSVTTREKLRKRLIIVNKLFNCMISILNEIINEYWLFFVWHVFFSCCWNIASIVFETKDVLKYFWCQQLQIWMDLFMDGRSILFARLLCKFTFPSFVYSWCESIHRFSSGLWTNENILQFIPALQIVEKLRWRRRRVHTAL